MNEYDELLLPQRRKNYKPINEKMVNEVVENVLPDENFKVRTKWMDSGICPVCGNDLVHKGKGNKPSDYVCMKHNCEFNKVIEN